MRREKVPEEGEGRERRGRFERLLLQRIEKPLEGENESGRTY